MKTVTVLQGQSLLDIAVEHTGSISAVFDIARLNNKSITDLPIPGEQLNVDNRNVVKRVLDYYAKNNIHPGTAGDVTSEGGIGYWKIGIDFKVS